MTKRVQRRLLSGVLWLALASVLGVTFPLVVVEDYSTPLLLLHVVGTVVCLLTTPFLFAALGLRSCQDLLGDTTEGAQR